MAITHETAVRNTLADAIDDAVNAGASPTANSTMEWRDSTTVLGTFILSDPAFGAAAGGTITLANTPITDASADATGTADNFKVKDKDGTVIFSGSITGSGGGGDIELDSTAITAGQELELTSFSYSAPA